MVLLLERLNHKFYLLIFHCLPLWIFHLKWIFVCTIQRSHYYVYIADLMNVLSSKS